MQQFLDAPCLGARGVTGGRLGSEARAGCRNEGGLHEAKPENGDGGENVARIEKTKEFI